MTLLQPTTTRLPLVRHNQLTGADKYGNNPLRPQDLSDQYISGNSIGFFEGYGAGEAIQYVSFPEVINVQAVELYVSASASLSWPKNNIDYIIENMNANVQLSDPYGSIDYSIDGKEVTDSTKQWIPLMSFSTSSDGDLTVEDAYFGTQSLAIGSTSGSVNLAVKDSNLKNLVLRFLNYQEFRRATLYTAPEDGGREVSATLTSFCLITPGDYYVYVIQDGPSAYDRAPLIPNITTQPTSSGYLSLAVGETSSITDAPITVSSSGTVTYQWYKNGTSISGATSNDYSIANAQTTNAGTYHCEIINTVAGKSTKLNSKPIFVNVGTGLARPSIFTASSNGFWVDLPKLSDGDESTAASIGVPPIPTSYTNAGPPPGAQYTSSYNQDYTVYAAFRERPISDGRLTVKYRKVGTTNSPNTVASATAQYSTNYTAGTPTWTTFATALGTDGTSDTLVYQLTSLPASTSDLAIRFEKNVRKGYNSSSSLTPTSLSTTGSEWTNPNDALNSSGATAEAYSVVTNVSFKQIYSCSTVAKASSVTISGTATYDLLSAVDSAAGIFGSTNYVMAGASLRVQYSTDNGSNWTSGLTKITFSSSGNLEIPTPQTVTGTNEPFSFNITGTDLDLTKIKIKLLLEVDYSEMVSDDGFGNTEYIGASGSGSATIKNLSLSYLPPTIELSTSEFRVNEIYLEYDVDQSLSETVSLTANKTNVSSGDAVILTPLFSTGSGSIDNGVGSVTSQTGYTVNPVSTTTYTLTVGSVTKTKTITVVAAPTATSLTPGSSQVINGNSTTLTPVFSNGTGKIGTTSGGSEITSSATSGTAVTVTPSATTTYYLTVTNSLGATASTSTQVEVVATPSASLARGAAVVTNGLTTTITPTFFNGTGKVGTSGQDSTDITATATSGSAITVTPPSSATTTYTLTVTATATGQKTTATTSIQTIAAPTITSFTVNGGSSVNVTIGNTVTLLGTFTGSGSVNNSVGSITTGVNKVITISSAGAVTYTLTASNTATTPATTTANVTITGYAAPVATSLTAAASSITNGNSTTITPVFSNGTGKIGTTAGGSEVTSSATSGVAVTVSPSSNTTYYLTVTNVPGSTASTSTSITVIAAPVATSLTAGSSTLTSGSSTSLTPVFSNGTGKIGTTAGGSQVTSSATSGTAVTVTPPSGATTTYYLTVTNSLGATASTSTSITTIPSPTISSFVTNKSSITNGNSLTLTPTFSNGTGKIGTSANGSDITSSATSGAAVTVSPTSTTTYYLTVTNAAGTSVSSNLTVTVKSVPTASLTASAYQATEGRTPIVLFPIYSVESGGSATINGIGAVSSAAGITVYPSTIPSTSYTLTVNNGLSDTGSTATSTIGITVVPVPVIQSLTFGTNMLLRGSSTTLTPVFSNGTGVITPGNISVTSGTPITISPTTRTTYTLTVKNTLDYAVTDQKILKIYIRPFSFVEPNPVAIYVRLFNGEPILISQQSDNDRITYISDLTAGDQTTFGYANTQAYIYFSPLLIEGTIYIQYGKFNQQATINFQDQWVQQPYGAGANLAYVIGDYQPVIIDGVSSNDNITNTVNSYSFPFTGNLSNLSISVEGDREIGYYYVCNNPSIDYCGDPSDELSEAVNSAGFYIYDVYIDLISAEPAPNLSPTATSLTPGASSITNGTSTTLTPVFSNGTGKIGTSAGGSDITASATSETAITVSPTSTTTYYLTVANYLGSDSTNTTVTVVAAPVATSLTAAASSITNGTSTTITPTFSNGTGKIGTAAGGNDITASATSGTAITVSPTSTKTYYLTVTNSLGATATRNTTVTVVAAPVATSLTAGASSITNGTSTTLTPVFSNGTGVITPGNISVTSGTAVTVSPTSTTNYTLTVTNAAGTTATTSTSVTVVAAPSITSLNAAASSITNGTSTTITPTFSNGTGKIGTTAGGNEVTASATSGTAITISPTSTTTYYLTVTNSLGASVSTSTTVTVVAAPVATSLTAGASSITNGTSTTLTPVFSNGTGVITPGNISATSGTSVTVTPLSTTTYTLTVTNSVGTTASTTTTVTVIAAPVATSLTSSPSIITTGNSATLTPVFSNGTGVITPGNISVTSGTAVTVSPTSTTNYTLTVTNAVGTTATVSTSITVGAVPVATSLTAAASSITNGTSTTLTPVFSNGTGIITPGNINVTSGTPATVSPTSTTSYTLTVTNAAGTTATTSTTVTVVAAPVATSLTVGASSITNGTSTTLTPVFSNGTGVITPGNISATSGTAVSVSPTSTTSYTLTVTNSLGATATTSTTVTVVAAPVATSLTAAASSITNGTSTTITPTFSNGTGKIGTTAGGSDVTASATSGTAITISPTSTTTYYLTVTNSLGATATRNTTVTVVAAPVATSLTAAASSITNGTSTTLTPVFSNGTGVITPGNISATSGNAVLVSPTSTTSYTLTVTNSVGTTASTTTTVTVVAAPVATSLTPAASSITFGTSTTITPTFSNGTGKIGTTEGGSQVTASATSGTAITVSPLEETTYYLTVTNSLGATATNNTTITVVAAPVATSLTAGSSSIVSGNSTTITPAFSDGAGKIGTTPGGDDVTALAWPLTAITVSPTSTTTYYLTVTNALGATATKNTTITVDPAYFINTRDNNTGDVTSGSGVSVFYGNTRDSFPGDTTTYGYAEPAYWNDTTFVTTSFASQSISSATLYVQTGYDYSADNKNIVSASALIEYSTDGGSNWTTLRSSSANTGSASASGQTASLSSMNLSNLKVRWTGQSADALDPFDNYYTAVAWIRVYDIYVYYTT